MPGTPPTSDSPNTAGTSDVAADDVTPANPPMSADVDTLRWSAADRLRRQRLREMADDPEQLDKLDYHRLKATFGEQAFTSAWAAGKARREREQRTLRWMLAAIAAALLFVPTLLILGAPMSLGQKAAAVVFAFGPGAGFAWWRTRN